ncbi:MAG: glycosyltransferase family 4 protein [Candidatus Dormibacteria bacterium]
MVDGHLGGGWKNGAMPNGSPVLLVIADSSRSGGPEHVLTLARELSRSGWSPLVACPPGPLVDRCRRARLAVATFPVSGVGSVLAPGRLRRMGRRWGAVVSHSHGLRAGALLRRARLEAPQVHTHHLDGWFTASRARVALHRSELRALARATAVQIAVSRSVARFLTEEVGVDERRVRVVANGIEPLLLRPRLRPSGRTVAVLCRLVESKGVDLAVLALATPAGRALRLKVGGTGPELERLIDLAYSLGVADRVDFVGEVLDRDGFFAGSDLAWVPSRAEPFGLSACEAMSSGLPVVASRVGGLPEILDSPRAGLAVSPANPAALASVSSALLDDPVRYARLANAGAERVRRHFTSARMAALTRGVYREAMGAG